MDKEVIIDRVAEILKETPASMQIVKKGGDRDKRFRYLAKHMVEKAIKYDALVLSENEMGIAVVFQNSKSKGSLLEEVIQDLKLVFKVTGFKNVRQILRNQKYIKEQRPKNEDYLYCWFWGISKEARGADTQVGKQMKDEFLKRAKDLNLPLYAETQTRRNTIVYQKFGFDLFHTWNRPDGKTMYFMKHVPTQLKEAEENKN